LKLVDYQCLLKLTHALLQKVGLDNFSVEAVANGLCEASLRGVDSHGINLLPHYLKSALSGRKNPKPNFQVVSNYPAFVALEADHAFGLAAGKKAMELGMGLADKYGLCAIAVSNSSHAGAMGSTCLRAARKGYMVFGFTNADSLSLTYGGESPFFGTNPVCFCSPRENEEPFCLDMATTKISWNKLKNARRDGINLAENLAANSEGESVTDPNLAASLFPMGNYKGFGLAAVVEILCSITTGMPYGKNIPSMFEAPMDEQRNIGQFYIVLKIDSAVNKTSFLSSLTQLSSDIRREPSKHGNEIMLPNDPEIKTSLQRKKEGIPIHDDLFQELRHWAVKTHVPFEL